MLPLVTYKKQIATAAVDRTMALDANIISLPGKQHFLLILNYDSFAENQWNENLPITKYVIFKVLLGIFFLISYIDLDNNILYIDNYNVMK